MSIFIADIALLQALSTLTLLLATCFAEIGDSEAIICELCLTKAPSSKMPISSSPENGVLKIANLCPGTRKHVGNKFGQSSVSHTEFNDMETLINGPNHDVEMNMKMLPLEQLPSFDT